MAQARLELCPRCGLSWFQAHPAGWRCLSCSLCVSEFQQSLANYVKGGGVTVSTEIANTDWGTTFESAACDHLGLEDVADQGGEHRHVDAIAADGSRWSFKVARIRIDDGNSSRRGRYWIPQVELETCEQYAFGVYDDSGVVDGVISTLPAAVVAERCSAFVESPRHDVEFVTRPAWSRFINPSSVPE